MRQVFSAVLPARAGVLLGELRLVAHVSSPDKAPTYSAELHVCIEAGECEKFTEELSLGLTFENILYTETWLRSACAFIITSAFCSPEVSGKGRPALAT